MTQYAAFGTILQMDDGSLVYTALGQVQDISGPSLAVDTEDATHHASPGAYEEAVPTIIRTGTVDFTILFDPAISTHGTTAGLLYVLRNRLKRSFKLILPVTPTKTWTFQGFVTSFAEGNEVGCLLTADTSIKVTGEPVLA